MLDKLVRSLSPIQLALIVILGTIIFVYFSNPPKTICDAQFEKLLAAQAGYLFPKKGKIGPVPGKFTKALVACRDTNSMGGCADYIEVLQILTDHLSRVSDSCMVKLGKAGFPEPSDFASYTIITKAIERGLQILLGAAWGEGPNTNDQGALHSEEDLKTTFSWLGFREVKTFCALKISYEKIFYTEGLENLEKTLISELPGFKALGFEKSFRRSLFSVSCPSYL